jgi:hypothetical protein
MDSHGGGVSAAMVARQRRKAISPDRGFPGSEFPFASRVAPLAKGGAAQGGAGGAVELRHHHPIRGVGWRGARVAGQLQVAQNTTSL